MRSAPSAGGAQCSASPAQPSPASRRRARPAPRRAAAQPLPTPRLPPPPPASTPLRCRCCRRCSVRAGRERGGDGGPARLGTIEVCILLSPPLSLSLQPPLSPPGSPSYRAPLRGHGLRAAGGRCGCIPPASPTSVNTLPLPWRRGVTGGAGRPRGRGPRRSYGASRPAREGGTQGPGASGLCRGEGPGGGGGGHARETKPARRRSGAASAAGPSRSGRRCGVCRAPGKRGGVGEVAWKGPWRRGRGAPGPPGGRPPPPALAVGRRSGAAPLGALPLAGPRRPRWPHVRPPQARGAASPGRASAGRPRSLVGLTRWFGCYCWFPRPLRIRGG